MVAGSRRRPRPLSGRCQLPGDKAISHRAVLLAAGSCGTSRIGGFAEAADCRASLNLVRALGCQVRYRAGILEIRGLDPKLAPRTFTEAVDCSRSGTTMRLGAGLVAGLPFTLELGGDPQLLRRPMARVAEPLRRMGAEVSTASLGRPPLRLRGGALTGIDFVSPQASAQVKSAVLLATLRAGSASTVFEPVPTRDHTERLLAAMGARVEVSRSSAGGLIRLEPGALSPLTLLVPGDASSAAVIATAAALISGSDVTLEAVSANPGRIGFFQVLRRMGARVDLEPRPDAQGGEPVADIRIRHGELQAAQVGPDEVPSLIDELPLIGLLATAAEGATEVRGAGELRVKESDRISGLVGGLRALGAEAEELTDGFVVRGPTGLQGGLCDALTDHRLAMTFTLAGLISDGPVEVLGEEYIPDSFPGFARLLRELS